MDSLPVELVAHILSFLPVQQVFPLMRVSGRFEVAARAVVRSKRRLGVGGAVDCGNKVARPMPAKDILNWFKKGDEEPFLFSMSLMTNLTVLRIEECEDRWDMKHVADHLILQNCRSLQQVCLGFDFPFPTVSPDHQSFPHLKQLFCKRLADETVLTVCPSLSQVICYELTTSALQLLDTKIVTVLKTSRISADAVPVVAEFTNLKVMHLDVETPFLTRFSSVFQNMHNLVDVKLFSSFQFCADDMMTVLCDKNPKLQFLRMKLRAGQVGDASLTAMSRLSHLRTICMDVKESRMTTTGFLTLLRGKSRPVMRDVMFHFSEGRNEDIDRSAIASEVMAMSRASCHLHNIRIRDD